MSLDFQTLVFIALIGVNLLLLFTVFYLFSKVKDIALRKSQFSLLSNFQNIKAQGIWGEDQLESLLAETLTSDQYSMQVNIDPNSNELVDATVNLVLKDKAEMLLPIDSKLPLEDYEAYLKADDNLDTGQAQRYLKNLSRRVKVEAKSISEKYIQANRTTDFAILFIPLESLYLLLAQQNDLLSFVRRNYSIILAGPSSLIALLNSLKLGFKAIDLDMKSPELWNLLDQYSGDLEQTFMDLDNLESKLRAAEKILVELRKRKQKFTKLQSGLIN